MRSVVNDKASSGVGMYKEIYGPDSEKRTKLKFEKMLIWKQNLQSRWNC